MDDDRWKDSTASYPEGRGVPSCKGLGREADENREIRNLTSGIESDCQSSYCKDCHVTKIAPGCWDNRGQTREIGGLMDSIHPSPPSDGALGVENVLSLLRRLFPDMDEQERQQFEAIVRTPTITSNGGHDAS